MAHNAVLLVFLAALALSCQPPNTAAFDIVNYVYGRFRNTIVTENITCENFDDYCEKSNEQFQTLRNPRNSSVNIMAVLLCKAILEVHVCTEESEANSIVSRTEKE